MDMQRAISILRAEALKRRAIAMIDKAFAAMHTEIADAMTAAADALEEGDARDRRK